MASSDTHQRKTKKSVRGDDGKRGESARNDEPSTLRGMLPCVFGVAGISLLIWALFYLYIPPEVISGKSFCTKIKNPASLAGDLSSITDWHLFAQELGVPGEEIQDNNQIEQILRIWEKRSGTPCVEKLIKTLNKINKGELAKKVTEKLIPSTN